MTSNNILLLINEINNTINNTINKKSETINYQKINKLFKITEKKINNKIVHINNYDKVLIQINTDITCIKCNKIATYKNQLIDKEYYCWTHAQNII
jgi:hypothetical protein